MKVWYDISCYLMLFVFKCKYVNIYIYIFICFVYLLDCLHINFWCFPFSPASWASWKNQEHISIPYRRYDETTIHNNSWRHQIGNSKHNNIIIIITIIIIIIIIISWKWTFICIVPTRSAFALPYPCWPSRGSPRSPSPSSEMPKESHRLDASMEAVEESTSRDDSTSLWKFTFFFMQVWISALLTR